MITLYHIKKKKKKELKYFRGGTRNRNLNKIHRENPLGDTLAKVDRGCTLRRKKQEKKTATGTEPRVSTVWVLILSKKQRPKSLLRKTRVNTREKRSGVRELPVLSRDFKEACWQEMGRKETLGRSGPKGLRRQSRSFRDHTTATKNG